MFSGKFELDGREHHILQNKSDTKIMVFYISKDDIDDNGKSLSKNIEYDTLKDFFKDYRPSY